MKNYKFQINGNKYSVEISNIEDNIAQVEVNGTQYEVEIENMPNMPAPTIILPKPSKQAVVSQVAPAPAPKPVIAQASSAPRSGSSIKSPLPGVILDVFVRQGDTVKSGQHLILLEAMKMENNIDADKEGVVKEIRVQRSDAVMEGDVLIVIE
ncbi:MAG: biotin/lipoyl-binding protein [Bacteroidales bacterium]|jgi:biotin carboxyl carrier protein|nr:biotin/lipoyl-binding protein [Bacteroidales bacterium]